MFRFRAFGHLLIFGIVFTVLSLPFIFGAMRPSFADNNPYAIFYSICNLPVTIFLTGTIKSFAEYLWVNPSLYQIDLAEYYVSVAFWSLFGFGFGIFKTIREGQGR